MLVNREQIISIIDYVEGNLTEDIFVNDVARQAYTSIPHLYRIFPYATGCTIGTYIRKRRLSLSIYDLIHTDKRIIDIAITYGYNSQESYIRAFKQMFGITPGKYRRAGMTVTQYPKFGFPQLKEVFMNNLNIYTDADRDACMPIVELMVKCAENARMNGIMGLEDFIFIQKNDFLTYMMMLVIDGVDPMQVKSIGESLLNSSNYTGSAHLERIIILEGALRIQTGENPRMIKIKLLTYMGEPYLKMKGLFPGDSMNAGYIQRLAALAGKNGLPESVDFEEIVKKMDNRDIQLVLKEVADQRVMVVALKGCGEECIKCFLSNMSKRNAALVLEELELIGKLKVSDILKFQGIIIKIANHLTETGKIKKSFPI